MQIKYPVRILDENGDELGQARNARELAACQDANPYAHITTEYMAPGTCCPDCGERGERRGHMGCAYPADENGDEIAGLDDRARER